MGIVSWQLIIDTAAWHSILNIRQTKYGFYSLVALVLLAFLQYFYIRSPLFCCSSKPLYEIRICDNSSSLVHIYMSFSYFHFSYISSCKPEISNLQNVDFDYRKKDGEAAGVYIGVLGLINRRQELDMLFLFLNQQQEQRLMQNKI